MSNPTLEEMRRALERGVIIRNRYFVTEEDPISALSDGATEAEISELENCIGYKLPLSYRLFLTASNGWDYVDALISLMSCDKIKTSYENESFKDWCSEMKKYDSDFPKKFLVIGSADMGDANYLLLLPEEKEGFLESPQEDYPIMYISSSTDYVYKNFYNFLLESEKTYQELVEEEGL
jgi:SMI1 / KNR4 family (SUKH-1)